MVTKTGFSMPLISPLHSSNLIKSYFGIASNFILVPLINEESLGFKLSIALMLLPEDYFFLTILKLPFQFQQLTF